MVEVSLGSLSKNYEEATVQNWFLEEGDPIEEGDDLVELLTEDGVITLQAPISGMLAEVYFDEGEQVSKDDLLCVIDNDSDDGDDKEE